jgi:myo-inositol-1(or 4)-monophosphatase
MKCLTTDFAAMKTHTFLRTLSELVQGAGDILLKYFGKIVNVRQKEHPSSVVCDADLAAEQYIIQQIRSRFPQDSIVAEESGYCPGSSDYTWVIDPLDGTSNFVAGIPWFGAQVGILYKASPMAAVIYVPTERALYFGASGRGVTRNGRRLNVTEERKLKNVLCAFSFDATADRRQSQKNTELLRRVSRGVRNIRATNSLIDFCYTLEGRFGGCVNLNTKIWDIVPVSVMLPEAGGKFTDLNGKKITFLPREPDHSYAVVGASRALHSPLLALLGMNNSGR